MRKNKIKLSQMLLIIMVFSFVFLVPVTAQAKKVNLNSKSLRYYNKKSYFVKLTKKIGKMKVKRSKKYRTFYAKGNKMVIGVDRNADIGSIHVNYMYVRNKGNKKVSIFGVKKGTSITAATKKLRKAGYISSSRSTSSRSYWHGDAEQIKLTFKNKKVKTFTYICAPTG